MHFTSVLRGMDVPQLTTDMRSAQSVVRLVKGIFLAWSGAMNHINMAVGEGKTLDRLQQQLYQVPGFEEMIVDKTPISNPEERECNVVIVMTKPPLREIQSTIAHTVANMNMMNRTRIRVRIVARA